MGRLRQNGTGFRRMAEQVVAVRKLLTSVGHDAERLAACFGRKSQRRNAQITGILDTLKALGHIA